MKLNTILLLLVLVVVGFTAWKINEVGSSSNDAAITDSVPTAEELEAAEVTEGTVEETTPEDEGVTQGWDLSESAGTEGDARASTGVDGEELGLEPAGSGL